MCNVSPGYGSHKRGGGENHHHQTKMEAFPVDSGSDQEEEQVAVEADCHQAKVTLSTRGKFKKNPNLFNSNNESPVNKIRTTRPRSKSDGSSERFKLK